MKEFAYNPSVVMDESAGFQLETDIPNQPEEANVQQEPPKEKRSPIQVIYDYLETFCYALAVMMVLLLFVFRMVSVSGESMRETLQHEDKLIISNLFYTPKTGDIVVISPDSEAGVPIIKRVIATEGQRVFIDYEDWAVYVDGNKLDEPYIEAMRKYEGEKPMNSGNTKFKEEFVVDDGCIFVMGDNRNHSEDSRGSYGFIDNNRVLGRVVIRLTPKFGFVD